MKWRNGYLERSNSSGTKVWYYFSTLFNIYISSIQYKRIECILHVFVYYTSRQGFTFAVSKLSAGIFLRHSVISSWFLFKSSGIEQLKYLPSRTAYFNGSFTLAHGANTEPDIKITLWNKPSKEMCPLVRPLQSKMLIVSYTYRYGS